MERESGTIHYSFPLLSIPPDIPYYKESSELLFENNVSFLKNF